MAIKNWKRQFSTRTLSLQQKLPILISLLLLTVLTAFTLVSYFSIRRVSVNNAKQRLLDISDQMTTMFGQSAQAMMFNYRSFANQPDVRQLLKTGDENLKAPVMSAMQRLYADSLIVLMELVDRNYNPVLIHTRDQIESHINIDSLRVAALSADTLVAGNLHNINGRLFHPIKTRIADSQHLGYVISWRRVVTSEDVRKRFAVLLGADARIYTGNADHSLWTDFTGFVDNPIPENETSGDPVFSYNNVHREQVLAARKNVPGTPWVFAVEFPKKMVVAPANTFLRWMTLAGLLIISIALYVTWKLSRRLTGPLQDLTSAATRMASENHHQKVNVPVNRFDEIGKLSRAFNTMVSKVTRSQEELEKKVAETEVMTGRLRELSAHLQNIREEERIHIAREMHDELGQLLTGFKMDVSWLHKKLGATTDPVVKEKLEEMMQVVNDAARFVRKLASELRPSILDDLGLIAALDWHSQEFKRRSNIEVEFRTALEELETSKEVATGLFRMYQESLTNVARHANARRVTAELEQIDGKIQLTITDDGDGFDTHAGERKTLGLLGMHERATMLKGQFRIYSAPGKGTTVLIIVPQHLNTYSPV